MTRGGLAPPGNSAELSPSASRLCFCTASCTVPLTFGSRSLSFCHFSPRASMVLYSDKRPARFWRKALSIASLKVSESTPGVSLASGTLPTTGFCADVCTCDVETCGVGPGAAPPAELEVELEFWAQSTAGKMTIDTISKAFNKKYARKRRNRRVGQSAEHMNLASLLQDGDDKSFGLFLLTIRCKLFSRLAMNHAPIPVRRYAPTRNCDLGHLV